MAQVKTAKFSQTLIEVGDGALPEIFAAPCGFETITQTITTETNNSNLPDCVDPDAPAWLTTDTVSKQMVLTGEGFLDLDSWKTVWQPWSISDAEKNVRWHLNLSAAQGGGYYEAPAKLTNFVVTSTRGQRVRVSVTLTMQGKPTWVPTPISP